MTRFDHTGKTYGAVTALEISKQDKHGPTHYRVKFACCDTIAELTQTQMNCHKNECRTQCASCRKSKGGRVEFTVDSDPNAINVPGWGSFMPMGQMGHRHGNNTTRAYGRAGAKG